MTNIPLNEIIDMLWFHPENAEWKPKIEVIPRESFRRWIASDDMEVLGFTYHLWATVGSVLIPDSHWKNTWNLLGATTSAASRKILTESGPTADSLQVPTWLM